ncbi:hypothetical protein [Nonlabens ponticola]|uniref:hypothetical protein n=1 Tax=Nonlabens ponticola TaxID=2496866 RepID=UPI0013DF3B5C|nr:hypothetical protein [Nonlabens ponticola]
MSDGLFYLLDYFDSGKDKRPEMFLNILGNILTGQGEFRLHAFAKALSSNSI